MNSKFTKSELDNYDAEVVEDIPEQFDLSRYKMKSKLASQPPSKPPSTHNNGSSIGPGPGYSQQAPNGAYPMAPNPNYSTMTASYQAYPNKQLQTGAANNYYDSSYHGGPTVAPRDYYPTGAGRVVDRGDQTPETLHKLPHPHPAQQLGIYPNLPKMQFQYPMLGDMANNPQAAIAYTSAYPNNKQAGVYPPSYNSQYMTNPPPPPPPPHPNGNMAEIQTHTGSNSISASSTSNKTSSMAAAFEPANFNPNATRVHAQVASYYHQNPAESIVATPQHQYTTSKKAAGSGKYAGEMKTESHPQSAVPDDDYPDSPPKYSRNAPSSASSYAWSRGKNDEKKKSTEDLTYCEDDSSLAYKPNRKKEYYLKGGGSDDILHHQSSTAISSDSKWMTTRENSASDDKLDSNSTSYIGSYKETSASLSNKFQQSVTVSTDILTNVVPKSNMKQTSVKKHGVTFDEKLEVYEVKNPHYGLDVKSEKRELKKKKKDRQKEEEIIMKMKFDMKAKVQNQNALYFNFFEKSLLYKTLVFYEMNYYRNSIISMHEKCRNCTKEDKLRDQLLQMIEKENQLTVEIIRCIKREYTSKLEPYCTQYQTTLDKLHTFPGMYQVMHEAANSVNYTELVKYYSTKDSGSPKTLKKILDSKGDKSFNSLHQSAIKMPLQRKADLWLPKHMLAAIDLHIRDVAYSNYKTLTDFIFKLNEICENDLQLARAIYKYVLITHLEGLRHNDTGALLMRNYDLTIESTNTIFSRLCSFAGIENHCIRGLWKTICSEPGEKIEAKCLWNVVRLENGWRFIQPAYTPAKYFSRMDVKYEETEYYFLSDADTLMCEFLPHDKVWQFSDNLVTVKEFEKRPIITPHFRTLNLAVVPNSNGFSNCLEKEPFKLAIRYPREVADTINFKYHLRPSNSVNNYNRNNFIFTTDSNHPANSDSRLNLFVISELITNEDEIIFKISSLPETGSYNFTVYAGLVDDYPQPAASSLASNLNGSTQQAGNDDMKAIMSLKITCNKIVHFETPPNHINEINVFGMNNTMKRLGLVCHDFYRGILGTDCEGRVNLVFEMTQPLDIEAYLYSSDSSISSKFLELCILKRVVHNFLIFIIYPPHPGLYGLDLHGATKGSFNSLLHTQLPPVGKYLIKSHNQVRTFTQFPRGDNRDWGPKQRFYDLGLHTVGYMDPYIVNEDGKQIEIEIAMLKSVTMWYKFDYDLNGTPKPIDNYCFMNYKNSNKKEKTVSFLLRFPYRGFYHLALMATDVFPSKPEEIVYNYLIRVQDPLTVVESFPIIVNPILWRDCCLIAPKNYRLQTYDVHFSITVPNTKQVQVTTNDRSVEKLESSELENSWVGLAALHEHTKTVFIEAEFNNTFKKLVKFRGPGNLE